MILLTILFIILAILIIFAVAVISVGGAVFTIVFADVIVCAIIIIWLIVKLIKRKR